MAKAATTPRGQGKHTAPRVLLDADVRRRVVAAAQRIDLTWEEIATLARVSERTLNYWRKRSKEIADTFPSDWRKLPKSKLIELANEVGWESPDETWTRERVHGFLRDRVDDLLKFFDDLRQARLVAEIEGVRLASELAEGGRWGRDQNGNPVWVPHVTRVVTEVEEFDAEGKVRRTIRKTTSRERGPSDRVSLFLLERRHRRFAPVKASSRSEGDDPEAFAARVQAALAEMDDSVPVPGVE